MILKQAKVFGDHPDLMKLRRGLVEKSLWVTVLLCFTIIGLLTAAVFYYKLQADKLPSETATSDTFSKIGGKYLASVVLSKMNYSVSPCDDFYQFACGRFEKTTIMPEDSGVVNTINMIEGRVMAQLHTLLNNEIFSTEIRPFKMAKQMYRQCMNTTQIEKNGLDFVKEKLKLNTMWPVLLSEDEWDESMWNQTDFYRYSVDFFIDADLKHTSRRALYITAASLGLGRDMLLRGWDDIIKAYHTYMVNVGMFFGANKTQAEKDFANVLLFEMMLANITIPKEAKRDSNKLYNPMTIATIQERYSYINWLSYINTKMMGGLKFNGTETVIMQQPSYYDQLENILNLTDKRTIANYVLWRDLSDYVPYLTSELREMEFAFFKTVTGKAVKQSRWSDCVKATAGMLNVAVSAMYVREYFYNQRIKHDVKQIINEISSEFEKVLHENTWMDEETKRKALKKLKSMHSNVAYPTELLDDSLIEGYYSNLVLNQTNYLQSAIDIDNHGKSFVCSRFHKHVNRTDWVDHATSIYVNANYNGKTNSIQIIAAMLQGHFFATDRPQYMNYASIGYVIGHEMTHGFDDLGRLYDADGNLFDWWQEDTKKAFVEKKNCIIEQYGNYTDKSINMSLNGVNTQGENIADNGGLKLAYRAYISSMKKAPIQDPMLPGLPFSPQQLFWISAAQTWCSIERPEIKKIMILTDNHAIGRFRVLGTLSNSLEFANDFKCARNSPMNPSQKCEVW